VTLTGRGPSARLINGIHGHRDNSASAGTPTHFHVRKTSPEGAPVTDRKIKPGTGERDHRLGVGLEAEPGRGDGTTAEVTRQRRGSGGGFEGDAKAQGGELADMVSDLAGRVDAVGVVIGPQIVEACGRVGQQVPNDDQD
jgi:hypothetical protein